MEVKKADTPEKHITAIFEKTFKKAAVDLVMENNFVLEGQSLKVCGKKFDISGFERVLLAGAGIAAYPMAQRVVNQLGQKVTKGVLLMPNGFGGKLENITIRQVTSPLVNDESRKALGDFLTIADIAKENDLVILLLSKGAAEAVEQLYEGIDFKDYNLIIKKLKAAGARDEDINAIRMHMSALKGGKLAARCHPATVISIVLSDEPGADINKTFLAPTGCDQTTFADCRQVLIRTKVALKLPAESLNHFTKGMQGKVPETLKAGDERLKKVHNFSIYGTPSFAKDAVEAAKELGYYSSILSTHFEGDPAHSGKFFGNIMKDLPQAGTSLKPPCAFIVSGRLDDSDDDRFGRCCELAMAVAREIEGNPSVYFLAGTSFLCDDKGAVACYVSGDTISRMRLANLHPEDLKDKTSIVEAMKAMDLLIYGGYNPNDAGDIFILMSA